MPNLFMEHDLNLAMLYINLRQQVESSQMQLAWQNTRMLELQNLGVQPDAHIAITRNSNTRKAFVEYTAARTSSEEITSKLDKYQSLFERLSPRAIWWMTKDKSTCEWITSIASKHSCGQYLMIAPYQDRTDLLTAPLWVSPVAEGLHAFVKLSISNRVNLT